MSTYQLTYPAGQALPAGGLLRAAAAASLAIPLLLAGTQATRLVAQPSSGAYVPFTKQTAAAAYGALPLAFEPNVGQAPRGAQYLVRTAGYEAFLGQGGAILAMPGQHRAGQVTRMTLVKLAVVGASPAATLVGLDRQPGITNYLVGNGTGFHTNVPNFAQVSYNNVYPGISMTYSGTRGGLEYSFTLQPGAGVSRIHLAFGGVRGISLDRQGDLLLRTSTGTIVERAPLAFQGSTRVHSSFTRLGPNTVGFSVGAYDHSKPLTIDPTIHTAVLGGGFSRFVGGSGDDAAYAIALDKLGNAYITGATYSPGAGAVLFPVVAPTGATELQLVNNTANASSNAFVTKLAPAPTISTNTVAGGTIIYSTYLGGPGVAFSKQQLAPGLTNGLVAPALPNAGDVGFGIAVDASGNAYVTGETYSPTLAATATGTEAGAGGFPVTVAGAGITGALQVVNNGNASGNNAPNAFVSVLNPTGASLLFSDVWGGAGITCNPAVGTAPTACTAGDGTSVGAQGGGTAGAAAGLGEAGLSIALDGATTPNIYIGGESFSAACPVVGVACPATGSAAFPMGTVVGQTINNGFHGNTATAGSAASNGFLVKFTLNPGKTVAETSTFFGGSGAAGAGDAIQAIALDPTFAGASATAPDVIATGFANSANFPVTATGVFQPKSGGGQDAFVAAFVNSLATNTTTFLGGPGKDTGNAVAVDNLGNIVVGGQTSSGDAELAEGEAGFPSAVDLSPNPLDNDVISGFVAELNPALTALNYSDLVDGDDFGSSTGVQGLAVDGTGSAYFTGFTTSATLPVKNALTGQGALKGLENAIVGKLSPKGGLSYLTYLGGGNTDAGFGIAVDSIGAAYVAGATDSPSFPNNTVASAAPGFVTGEPFNGTATPTTAFDAFVTEVAPKENIVTPPGSTTPIAVPICAVVAAVVGSNSRLGAAVVYPTGSVFPDVPSAGGPGFFPALAYISFQVGSGTTAASAVVRGVEQFPTPPLGSATITTCSVGTNNLNFVNGTTPGAASAATLTFTGTIARVRGSRLLYSPGDAIVVTFTKVQGATVGATITDTTKGTVYVIASLTAFSSIIIGTF